MHDEVERRPVPSLPVHERSCMVDEIRSDLGPYWAEGTIRRADRRSRSVDRNNQPEGSDISLLVSDGPQTIREA